MGSEGGDPSRETLGVDLPSGLERAAAPPGVRSIITILGGGAEASGSRQQSRAGRAPLPSERVEREENGEKF
jgi:hypothetical protein